MRKMAPIRNSFFIRRDKPKTEVISEGVTMSRLQFKYVRIQGKELARNTMHAKGVFSMCWQMIQDDTMEEEDADLYREIDSWFA